jgi:excisionase family DNA binding protein
MTRKPLAGTSPDETLTIQEAADRLGVSPRLIRKAIRDETLPATIPGQPKGGKHSGRLKYRIQPADLRKWFFRSET